MHMNTQILSVCLVAMALAATAVGAQAAEPVCQEVATAEMESTTTCVYSGMSQAEVYSNWRETVEGGSHLRAEFPAKKISDTLPENNEEGLVQVDYDTKNGVWHMELGYQGGTTTVALRQQGDAVTLVSTMSAD